MEIITKLLILLARTYVWRFKPKIIAITGNVGKTSAKDAIGAVLGRHARIRVTGGNLNTRLGVAMTILGDWSDEYYKTGGGKAFWKKILIRGFLKMFSFEKYPEILVLEYGADQPGDIAFLAGKFRPSVAVVTAVGAVPVHVERFPSPKAVAQEKGRLIESLGETGQAILNFDDPIVMAMRDKTKSKVLTYGFGEGADLKISNFDYDIDSGVPQGIIFKLNYKNGFTPMRLKGSLGRTQAYAACAAATVAVSQGVNLVDVSSALANFESPAGRMKILRGIKGSTIIDDTYNAAPAAMQAAIETLQALPAKRKVAVLGDMLELGEYSLKAHENIGNLIGDVAQILICVGEKAKLIAEVAGKKMDSSSIFTFHTSNEAKLKVQELIEEGDLVLVKGSQGKRMEKVVEEIMAEPERKSELLVRQSEAWKSRS